MSMSFIRLHTTTQDPIDSMDTYDSATHGSDSASDQANVRYNSHPQRGGHERGAGDGLIAELRHRVHQRLVPLKSYQPLVLMLPTAPLTER